MNPYTILGAVLVVLAAAAGGYVKGERTVRGEWAEERLLTAQANLKAVNAAITENSIRHKADEANTRQVVENYENIIVSLQAKAATDIAAARTTGGLRVNRAAVCDRTPASGSPPSSVGADANGTTTVELPPQVETDLFTLADDADQTVAALQAKVTALQQLLRDYGHYQPLK